VRRSCECRCGGWGALGLKGTGHFFGVVKSVVFFWESWRLSSPKPCGSQPPYGSARMAVYNLRGIIEADRIHSVLFGMLNMTFVPICIGCSGCVDDVLLSVRLSRCRWMSCWMTWWRSTSRTRRMRTTRKMDRTCVSLGRGGCSPTVSASALPDWIDPSVSVYAPHALFRSVVGEVRAAVRAPQETDRS
jgi:hypothetical protein